NKGTWSQSLWQLRAACLVKAAHIMTARRLELSALIVYEAGKSIPEAIGDVDEAIDFLNYYAREEGKFHSKGNNGRTRGVTGVISPWNFPLAIPCGMVAAPLVAGNSVVLKSAE
ncbi:MAG: L-glutamate gamma-semialdehyde dehydrogenase, partial [Bdellovibrio sp. CG_4_9_14_3_um_filter_39_7]